MRTTCWLTITALILSITGCQGSFGTFGWFRSKENWQQAEARQRLKNPTKVDLNYAKLAEAKGHIDEARPFYERVIEDNPKSVEAVLGLARVDQLSGRRTAAEEGFQKALQLSPNSPVVLDAAGQFYQSEGNWVQAIQYFNSATLAAPTNATYRYNLAVALARTGQIEAARPHFVRSVGDAEADYNIGYILFDDGEFDRAEQFFSQALVKNPALAQATDMLEELRSMKEDRLMLASASEETGEPLVEDLSPPPGYGHATQQPIQQVIQAEAAPQEPGHSIPSPIQQTGSEGLPQ